jgi:hypothetical protein
VIFAFGAHPTEPLIVYGDNYGTFYAQWFSHEGFGRTKKIVDKIQSGNSVCFINEGRTLLLGGSGYVQLYKYEDGKFLLEQEMSTAVRHLVWIESKQVLAINQGMHGVALYQLSDGKLTTLERVPTELAVQHLAFSNTFKEMAVLFQEQTQLSIYAIDC